VSADTLYFYRSPPNLYFQLPVLTIGLPFEGKYIAIHVATVKFVSLLFSFTAGLKENIFLLLLATIN